MHLVSCHASVWCGFKCASLPFLVPYALQGAVRFECAPIAANWGNILYVPLIRGGLRVHSSTSCARWVELDTMSRLETRTKESNSCASLKVVNL